jgi:hypothetical protein
MLDANGMGLVPLPNTPLYALVEATRADRNFNIAQEDGSVEPDVDSIEYIANVKDETLGISQHDVVADQIVQVAGDAVAAHILFAKTIVAPAVQALVEKTISDINQLGDINSLLGMEVVMCDPAKPLMGSGIYNAVQKFDETPYDPPALKMSLPTIPYEQIIQIMQSGSGSMDADIAEWAASKGNGFFEPLWADVFQQNPVSLNDTRARTFNQYTEHPDFGADYALAIFLIARKLSAEPLQDTQMSKNAHYNLMIEFRNQAGARLCRALNDLDRIAQRQILVRSTTTNKVVVNGQVYRDWIEAGGDNEVLFGLIASNSTLSNVSAINEKAAELKSKWQQFSIITQTAENNRRFDRIKSLLASNFENQMRTATAEEELDLTSRSQIMNLFRDLLDRVCVDETKDMWKLCLKLVCRSRFVRTEAERILAGIERIKKNNPEATVPEAAAASVIDYIAYWLSKQYKVVAI